MTNALIMAGGRGERLKPLTDECPKPLLKVGGRPIISRVYEGLYRHNIIYATISTGYMAEMMRSQCGDAFSYVYEDTPLGTAGALSLVEPGEWIVVNGDILCDVDYTAMVQFHRATNAAMTVGYVEKPMSLPYGVLELDGYKVQHLREKPTAVRKVLAGVYVVSERACHAVRNAVNKAGRCDMTDVAGDYVRLGLAGNAVAAFPITADWIDIGSPDDYRRACAKFEEVKV